MASAWLASTRAVLRTSRQQPVGQKIFAGRRCTCANRRPRQRICSAALKTVDHGCRRRRRERLESLGGVAFHLDPTSRDRGARTNVARRRHCLRPSTRNASFPRRSTGRRLIFPIISDSGARTSRRVESRERERVDWRNADVVTVCIRHSRTVNALRRRFLSFRFELKCERDSNNGHAR